MISHLVAQIQGIDFVITMQQSYDRACLFETQVYIVFVVFQYQNTVSFFAFQWMLRKPWTHYSRRIDIRAYLYLYIYVHLYIIHYA